MPGRELHGIHQAMDYLTLANRVTQGDCDAPAVTADGKHVVIIGGGDTGSDCMGTALRQGAASVVQLDINPEPGDDRPDSEPWPVYPKIYRISHAHEEARGRRGADPRVFASATLRFEGDRTGRVRELRLAEVEPETRRPLPGTERGIPADLVLLALGFYGPERDTGLMRQLGLTLDGRGNFARNAGFGAETADPPGRAVRRRTGGIFIAGDAGRGQSLVVWAIAEGRSAAAATDRCLSGSTVLPAPIAPQDRPLVA